MISLCMIVKNEIDVLERCILSVREKIKIVDEIIVVDTGSTDGTKELAEKLGCKVYDFIWCNDFSSARNFSLEKATNEMVLILDADEFVVDVDLNDLNKFVKSKNKNAIGEITVVNYGDKLGERFTISELGRIFNKESIRYRRIIHEIPDTVNGEKVELCSVGIVIHHSGYVDEVKKDKDKIRRNLILLKKAIKEDSDMYLVMHLGKTYIDLEEYELALESFEKIIYNENCVKYTYYTESVKEYIRCLLNAEMYEKALECEKYWDRCNCDESYVYFLGHTYLKNGLFEKAMDCFMKVINSEGTRINKVDAIYSLAQMFSLLGFTEESVKYFDMCGDYANAKVCASLERGKIKK